MTVSLTIPPTGVYLTTLPAVKQELLIPTADTSADIFLGELIAESTETVYAWAGRPLYRAQWTETLQGNSTNSQSLVLSRYPVAAVESLSVNGSAITDYVIEKEQGLLRRTMGNWADLWSSWPGSTWTVVYTAGWFLAPDDFLAGSYTVDSADSSYNSAANYFHPLIRPGDVILAQNFLAAGNNGLKVVATASTATVTVTTALTTATAQTANFFVRNLPGWIERACIDLIKLQYHRRDRDPGMTSISVGPASSSWDMLAIDRIERRVRALAMAG